MGATLDQFDTIDFSENDIRKLDGFPLLKRLKCLLMNSNRMVYVYHLCSIFKKIIHSKYIPLLGMEQPMPSSGICI